MFQDLDVSCINRNWLVEILAETGTIYSDNYKENNDDDDDYLPTVEEILYTALHKEGFAMEGSSPDHTARGIDEVAPEETSSSVDHSRSTPDDGLGTSQSELSQYPPSQNRKPPFSIFCL